MVGEVGKYYKVEVNSPAPFSDEKTKVKISKSDSKPSKQNSTLDTLRNLRTAIATTHVVQVESGAIQEGDEKRETIKNIATEVFRLYEDKLATSSKWGKLKLTWTKFFSTFLPGSYYARVNTVYQETQLLNPDDFKRVF
jgi:DNA polymerase III delta subunit